MMNIDWKIGVNNQAMVLTGSTPGLAGSSGGAGVGEGAAARRSRSASEPGTQAATTIARRIIRSSAGPIRRKVGERVTSAAPR